MPMPDTTMTSSTYVRAVARALVTQAKFDAVVARCGPEVAAMLKSPLSQAWWPGPLLVELTRALGAEGGEAMLRTTGRLAIDESMLPVVRPLIRVVLALGGATPNTLFTHFPRLAIAGVKNVRIAWNATGPTSGNLTLDYPFAAPAEYLDLWVGAVDYCLETTKPKDPRVTSHAEGTRLRFEVSWS
jgi:hypothetical protein